MKEIGVMYNESKIVVEITIAGGALKIDDKIVDKATMLGGGVLCGVLPTGERVSAFLYAGTTRTKCILQVNGLTVLEK